MVETGSGALGAVLRGDRQEVRSGQAAEGVRATEQRRRSVTGIAVEPVAEADRGRAVIFQLASDTGWPRRLSSVVERNLTVDPYHACSRRAGAALLPRCRKREEDVQCKSRKLESDPPCHPSRACSPVERFRPCLAHESLNSAAQSHLVGLRQRPGRSGNRRGPRESRPMWPGYPAHLADSDGRAAAQVGQVVHAALLRNRPQPLPRGREEGSPCLVLPVGQPGQTAP